MRLQTYRSMAFLFAALSATIACHSGQKQTFLPPVQAEAPALKPAGKTPDPPQAKAAIVPAPVPQPQAPPAVASDPVVDLIAHVEKEYQAGQDSYHAGNLEAA